MRKQGIGEEKVGGKNKEGNFEDESGRQSGRGRSRRKSERGKFREEERGR